MKKLISGIALCLIVASGALYYFVFSDNELIEVTSDDKQFTLSISPDSLPEGISSDDLSIEKLDEEELSEFEQALEPFAVYRLGPDGTELNQSADFKVVVETSDDEFTPSIIHLAGDSIETVSNLQVEKNADGTFMLQGSIDHFSDIVITRGFFGSEMADNFGTHLVGESFTVTVTLKKREIEPVSKGLERVLEGDPKFVKPGEFSTTMMLSPEEITDLPKADSTFDSETMSFEGTFTCTGVGDAYIFYLANLSHYYNFYQDGIAGLSDIFNYVFPASLNDNTPLVEKATVTCVEPSKEDLEAVLDYEVSTVCGTTELSGRVEISGTLIHTNVKGLSILIDDKAYTPTFDPSTGNFTLNEEFAPGMYSFEISAITTLGNEIMLKSSSFISVPRCPEEEEETPWEPEEPFIYIDPTPDETDPVEDEALTCTTPEDDTCSNPAQYGFPVCDETNLPIECKATDSRPGWDCYTFEDASCEPSTRCFCIAPAEGL